MTTYNILTLFSVLCVFLGILALVTRNETVSTRKSITQGLFVAVVTGGLISIDGNVFVGTVVSMVALIAYGVLRAKYTHIKQTYLSRGMQVPEQRKM